MNMYVSNLGFHVTDEDLRKLFADFGVVDSAKVIMDRMTNQSRGFGFVEMQNDTEAEAAMQKLAGKEIEGRSISVSKAKPKTDTFSNNRNSRW